MTYAAKRKVTLFSETYRRVCLYILRINNICRNLGARTVLTEACLLEGTETQRHAGSMLSTTRDTRMRTSEVVSRSPQLSQGDEYYKTGALMDSRPGCSERGNKALVARMPELSLESQCPRWGDEVTG